MTKNLYSMKNKICTILIPVRMGSSRLPDKPLRKIAGKPLLKWVIELAENASFNKSNEVVWLPKLSDCEVQRVDIAADSRWASEYKIVVVPTLAGAAIVEPDNNSFDCTFCTCGVIVVPVGSVGLVNRLSIKLTAFLLLVCSDCVGVSVPVGSVAIISPVFYIFLSFFFHLYLNFFYVV